MKRPITPTKEMNKLYQDWESSRDPMLYDRLIQAVINNTFNRFSKVDGRLRADEIAAIVGSKIYRALPGYLGPSPLKAYDSARGRFNAFQSTMARTTRLDYLKRPNARGVGDNELSYSGSEAGLEKMYYSFDEGSE